MTQFQGFDNRNNGGGIAGIFVGTLCGLGTFIGLESFWWRMGWGPGDWNRSDIFHAYWLAFIGHVIPSYKGDLGTWISFGNWLRSRHQYDSFAAAFWIPFLVGIMTGLLTAWLVVRSANRSGSSYVRGSQIKE